MGEPTYRLLTGDDLWLPGDALPGLLDGWCGPFRLATDHVDYAALTRRRHDGRCLVASLTTPAAVSMWAHEQNIRLDCRRPEIRDHARRVLLAGERCGCHRGWVHVAGPDGEPSGDRCPECNGSGYLRKPADIGPIVEAELRGDITPTEAAGLVWCSLLRVEVGLGVVGPPLTVEPDEGDLSEWLADGWTLWSDGALLMPLPDGVIGRLEVSDG